MTSDDLVTGGDIGRRLGVSRERVRQWATGEQYGFPESVARLGAARVWRWADVEAWYEEYRRAPRKSGRPKKGGE